MSDQHSLLLCQLVWRSGLCTANIFFIGFRWQGRVFLGVGVGGQHPLCSGLSCLSKGGLQQRAGNILGLGWRAFDGHYCALQLVVFFKHEATFGTVLRCCWPETCAVGSACMIWRTLGYVLKVQKRVK
jgi:hypothetical protein